MCERTDGKIDGSIRRLCNMCMNTNMQKLVVATETIHSSKSDSVSHCHVKRALGILHNDCCVSHYFKKKIFCLKITLLRNEDNFFKYF